MGFVIRAVVAAGAAYLLLRMGIAFLKGFGRPVPDPPPIGELRKVRLRYRCPQCGLQLRVDAAAEEDPIPPRHCMDEMDLIERQDV